MRQRTSAASSAGFTIVEVLIVVILISILVGLAIPAFIRTQAQAKRLECKTNLRQVFLGLDQYATANRGMLPTCLPGGEGTIPFVPGVEVTGPPAADVSTAWIGGRTRPWGLGKIHAQLGENLQVLFCPSDPAVDADAVQRAFAQDRLLNGTDTPASSYLFRGRSAPDPANPTAVRLLADKGDSVRALVMDHYYAGMARFHHGQRICVLFEDGSAEDFQVSKGNTVNRFVDPLTGQAALDRIWRIADAAKDTD